MRSVITQNFTRHRPIAPRPCDSPLPNLLVIGDHLDAVAQRGAGGGRGPAVVWNPEGLDEVPSTCAWDLIGAAVDAPAADRLAQHLLSPVLENRLASFFVPEASLLVANMLLAASRSGTTFADVLDWVWQEDAAPAALSLRTSGEFDAYEDVLAFLAQDQITQGSVWETTQMALKPLNYGPVLDAIARPGTDRIAAPAPFAALHVPAGTALRPSVTVQVLRSTGSPYSGVGAALVDELLRVASEHARPTTVLELNTYGRAGGSL